MTIEERLNHLDVRSIIRGERGQEWEVTTFEREGRHWHGSGATLEDALDNLQRQRERDV